MQLRFEDNDLAQALFGPQENHVRFLSKKLGIGLYVRGNEVTLAGDASKVAQAAHVLNEIYALLKKGVLVSEQDFEQILFISSQESSESKTHLLEPLFIPGRKKTIFPKTQGQKRYLEAIDRNDLTFCVGPAGTGKTYLAVAQAVCSLLRGDTERLVLTRPAIEAGEKLGFLPGDLAEKVNPYLRPLHDAMHDLLEYSKVQAMLHRGQIEVAPLAFMRGRTLNDAFVILDEAQNCTIDQMKMFLTRIGYNSKAVITGDVTQIDLPRDKKSGLNHALHLLKGIDGISIHYLTQIDVVRHPLVRKIIEAYEQDTNTSV